MEIPIKLELELAKEMLGKNTEIDSLGNRIEAINDKILESGSIISKGEDDDSGGVYERISDGSYRLLFRIKYK